MIFRSEGSPALMRRVAKGGAGTLFAPVRLSALSRCTPTIPEGLVIDHSPNIKPSRPLATPRIVSLKKAGKAAHARLPRPEGEVGQTARLGASQPTTATQVAASDAVREKRCPMARKTAATSVRS